MSAVHSAFPALVPPASLDPRDLTMQLREELMTAPPRQVTPHCAWFRTNLTENTALKVLLAVADAI
ncbi:MAG: hypothetical protein M9950_02140 [Thermomicrobiales bacterium]|nr:hypothetical protein [Thermomicrobiales bacterium]